MRTECPSFPAKYPNERRALSLTKGCLGPPTVYALRASDIGLVALTESLESPAIPGKMHNIMAVSRPVVAVVPSKGNTAEVVRESRCGFVVVPGDKEDLRNRIEELAGRPDLRNELGAHGRSYAEQNFSLEKAADTYERILKDAQDKPI